MEQTQILLVDDDPTFRTVLSRELAFRGHSMSTAETGQDCLKQLLEKEMDIVLLDLKLKEMDGLQVLEKIKEACPNVEVIVLTGHGAIDTAVHAIRLGAYDYLTKPCPTEELELAIQKATECKSLRERANILSDGLIPPDIGADFVGESRAFKDMVHLIRRVASSGSTVLIHGETGVGKEMAAKLLHVWNETRRHNPFVVVDCGALHEQLLQSELFGHEKGAFTGAARLKHGLFEVANSGTIFLDEIGDISPSLQVKLLRVLESGVLRRVGGTREIRVDVRVVTATNRNLQDLIQQGRYREDLFYRLNAIRVEVPALRDRAEDIPVLIRHYTERYNAIFSHPKHFSAEAMSALKTYRWPGNVRQLVHVVEGAMLLSEGPVIGTQCLPSAIRTPSAQESWTPLAEGFCPLKDVEKRYIEYVLAQFGGHRARVAEVLGISERSLYRKIKEFRLE